MKEANKIGTLTWLIPVLSAVIGLIGGALGYSIQNYYAIKQEEQKSLIASRRDAYINYFEAQAKYNQYYSLKDVAKDKRPDKLLLDSQLQVRKAEIFISIFSTKPVVKALAILSEKNYPIYSSDNIQKEKDYIQVLQQMRSEVFMDDPKQKVDDQDLSIIIDGVRLDK